MLPDGTNRTERTGSDGPDIVSIDLDVLDRERRVRGWTKVRLAEAMGVTKETISDIYRRSGAAPETFGKLTAALEASPAPSIASVLMGEPSEGAA